jgi:hypothetical protein
MMTSEVKIAYFGSDGEATKALYAKLEHYGTTGILAVNLLRAQKCSSRAKVYRGGNSQGSYKRMSYDRKQWAIDNLCKELSTNADQLGIRWGWKEDPTVVFGENTSYVLYVDLPQGQISFHSPVRGAGKDYEGNFDGQHKSAERIIEYAEAILGEEN